MCKEDSNDGISMQLFNSILSKMEDEKDVVFAELIIGVKDEHGNTILSKSVHQDSDTTITKEAIDDIIAFTTNHINKTE